MSYLFFLLMVVYTKIAKHETNIRGIIIMICVVLSVILKIDVHDRSNPPMEQAIIVGTFIFHLTIF